VAICSWDGVTDFSFWPHLDSIGGFCAAFRGRHRLECLVHDLEPPLIVFGMQIAVAFYLINVSEFRMQTSLEVARDRVVGILLGLFAMWLIFEQLWGMPAVRELKRLYFQSPAARTICKRPASKDLKAATARRFALGETMNTNLDKVRALADGVLLEFGRSREQDLALAKLVRRAQLNASPFHHANRRVEISGTTAWFELPSHRYEAA